MIDVDAQHRAAEVIKALTGEVGVGVAGTVSRRNVQVSVVSECQVPAVVAVGGPVNDDRPGIRVDASRRRPADSVANNLVFPVRSFERPVEAKVDVAVVSVVRVKRQADGEAVDIEQVLGLGRRRALVVCHGKHAARPRPEAQVLENEQARRSGFGVHSQRLLDVQAREGPHSLVRGRRFGRADHARCIPGNPPRQAKRLLRGRLKGGGEPAGKTSKIRARTLRSRIGIAFRWNRSSRVGTSFTGSGMRAESGGTGSGSILHDRALSSIAH